MTAIGNVTLNSVVYSPRERQNSNGFVYVDKTSTYPAGQGELSFSGPTVRNGGSVKRVGFRLTFPSVATEASTCACPGSITAESVVTIYVDVDTRQSATELVDLCARIDSLVSTPLFTNAVKFQEGVW